VIIQVRGTSGSGKSWVMRTFRTAWGTWQPVTVEGRKRPLYYRCGWEPPGWVRLTRLRQVWSGGQTGADRAALEAAKACGLITGGWMPKGFIALDGRHPEFAAEYGTTEHQQSTYPPRTEANVRDTEATLRIATVWDSPGERLTARLAKEYGRPVFDVKPGETTPEEVRRWLEHNRVTSLNVAGNSESTSPGIQAAAREFLMRVFAPPPLTVVLGHYESACGGCDTIGSARAVYDLIQTFPQGTTVVCEGLLLSEDTKWTLQLPDVRCLFLTTPLDTCLTQIKSRREEAGNEKELNPLNTTNRVATIERARLKLVEAGMVCRRASATQAPGIMLRWLRDSHAVGG
jgi:hypothetical protein